MTDDLYEYLFRLNDDESILNLTQSSETLNVSAAVTENDHLHNRVKPSLGYLTRIRRWVRSRGNVGQIASYTAVVGGLLAGGVFYQIARYVDVPRITFYINDYNVLSGRLSSVSAQAAVVGLVSAMSVAMLTAVILHLVRRKATPPPHGQPISLVLTTPGDGTSDSCYVVPDDIDSTFREAISQAMPGAELSPATTTHGDRLGLSEQINTGADATDVGMSDLTPYIAEITYQEGTPFDALVEGTTTEALLDREGDDAGLLPSTLLPAITGVGVPILVQITTTARPSDAHRNERIAKEKERLLFTVGNDAVVSESTQTTRTASQTGEWATDIDTDGATENDPLPSLTHLYDVSIQLLIFDSADGTTAETVCEDVATVVKGVLPDGVETVDYRLARANASGVLGKSSRWRARRLVSRLRNRTVPVAGAYRLYGLKAHLGLHDRTAIPVTSRELWSYILLAGKSTARADRSQGSKPRDATVIPRPGEKQMAPLRWAQSWTTFVDGESSETGATGTGRDPADADTGTDHEMPSDSEKTVTTEPTGQQARTWRAWVTELVQSVWSVLGRSHESDRSSANMEDTDESP